MTRLPVEKFPKWSRDIERVRLMQTTLTSADISTAVGKYESWWSTVCLNIEPPSDWDEYKPKIQALLKETVSA